MNTPAEHHAQRIHRNMTQTMQNIVRTNNCIVAAQDKNLKARLKAKNDSRTAALEQMRRKANLS